MKKRNGYVGLLVLLGVTALIAFLFVRMYLSSEEKGMGAEVQNNLPLNPDGSVPQTRYEQLQGAKRAAEGVQGIVDEEGKKIQNEIKP